MNEVALSSFVYTDPYKESHKCRRFRTRDQLLSLKIIQSLEALHKECSDRRERLHSNHSLRPFITGYEPLS